VIAIEPTTTGEPTRRKHRRPRFSDEAAARTELIISGKLSAGEFIRPETVAQELEISVTPAREGLLALQSEGFLKVQPRRGFLVSPLSTQDVRDTFEAQALLAGAFAARTAVVATPADVRALKTLQTGLDAATEGGNYDRVEQLNFEFHRTIYRMARAPKISWLLGATLRYVPREFFAAVPGGRRLGPRSPRRPHRAAQPRRRGAARAAMGRHVTGAGALLAEHLAWPRGADR